MGSAPRNKLSSDTRENSDEAKPETRAKASPNKTGTKLPVKGQRTATAGGTAAKQPTTARGVSGAASKPKNKGKSKITPSMTDAEPTERAEKNPRVSFKERSASRSSNARYPKAQTSSKKDPDGYKKNTANKAKKDNHDMMSVNMSLRRSSELDESGFEKKLSKEKLQQKDTYKHDKSQKQKQPKEKLQQKNAHEPDKSLTQMQLDEEKMQQNDTFEPDESLTLMQLAKEEGLQKDTRDFDESLTKKQLAKEKMQQK